VIARRAERGLVRLSHHTQINEQVKLSIQFLNRISDYFFVLARKLTSENRVEEVIWKKETTL
jgi:cob(I)alamin adenosyltransferase